MSSKRKRTESDEGELEAAVGDGATTNVKLPQALWRSRVTADDLGQGEDEVTISAIFQPKGASSVDHLRLALGMLSRFNDTVRLIFCRPGVQCVDLPDLPIDVPDPETPKPGTLRVVKDRDGVGDLLCAMAMDVEVSVLSDDEQSVNVKVSSLLKFLKPMDSSVTLKLVKYRSKPRLNLFWTSDEYPGRQSHVEIGEMVDVNLCVDGLDTQAASWTIFCKACAPRPLISVILSIQELLRLLGSLKMDNEEKKSNAKNQFSKGSGSAATFQVEFLLPEPLPDSDLRQIEFHMGGVFPAEANMTFFEKFLAVESEKEEPKDEFSRVYQEQRLEVDLTLHDHHLRASNRPRTTFDVLARQRFSSDLVRSTVDALSLISPTSGKITLFFGLPRGFDWTTDFSSAPHHRGRWVEDVPLGLSVESDRIRCWVYLVSQTVPDDEES